VSKLNLTYNNDNFSLSVYAPLRRISNKVLDIIKSGKELKPQNLPTEISYFYQRNTSCLLSLLDLKETDDVLEVNPCFGTLTETLCDKVNSVTAVEFSKRNAELINLKLEDKDNLEIIVGNFKKIKFDKQFDYIFLTDILEFAAFFFKSEDPYQSFIDYFKKLLKPNGKIILFVSNKLGIKNFAGAFDEHTLERFDALEDYPKYSIKAFTKVQLEKLLNECGFENYKFYYPMPSHYHVYAVLSDDFFNQSKYDYSFVKYMNGGYLYDQKYNSIDARNVLHKLCAINDFQIFANSFFIIAGSIKPKNTYLYSTFVNGIGKAIIQNDDQKQMKLIPYNQAGKNYLAKMHKIGTSETKRLKSFNIENIIFNKITKKKDYYITEIPQATSFKSIYHDIRLSNNESALLRYFIDLQSLIFSMYPEAEVMDFSTEKMTDMFGVAELKNVPCAKNIIMNIDLDEIYNDGSNFILTNYGNICPYYMPINYVVFSMLYKYCNELILRREFLELLDISLDEAKVYMHMFSYQISHPNRTFA
jgi:2-polyprenyl-3-methyl-5-hydroxy-6-metoxy-1,4-benzoquinol methylase